MHSGRRAAERYRDRPAAAIVPAVADDQVFQSIGAAEAAAGSAGLGRRQSVGSDAVKNVAVAKASVPAGQVPG